MPKPKEKLQGALGLYPISSTYAFTLYVLRRVFGYIWSTAASLAEGSVCLNTNMRSEGSIPANSKIYDMD